MIDWLKLRVPLLTEGRIRADTVLILSPDGEVKWQKVRSLAVVGSFEANVHVSTCGYTGRLIIDGNPAKFFQGHNVFGTEDIHGLAWAITDRVLDVLELAPTEEQACEISLALVEVMAVHLTGMYDTGSLPRAVAAVRALSEHATLRHRGRGLLREGTAYFGIHSRRSALKAYPKGHELIDHPLPAALPQRERIIEWAQSKLRIEAVLRTMELKERGLSFLCQWTPETGATLHREMVEKLNVPENLELPAAVLEGLAPRLRMAYVAWQHGEDLRASLPGRTFRRYRKELLEHGIDLLSLRAKERSNVVPLIQVIRCVPCSVPEWAVGTEAYFEPRRRTA